MTLLRFRSANHPQQVKARGANEDVDSRETHWSTFDPLNFRFGFTIDVAAAAVWYFGHTLNRLWLKRHIDSETAEVAESPRGCDRQRENRKGRGCHNLGPFHVNSKRSAQPETRANHSTDDRAGGFHHSPRDPER